MNISLKGRLGLENPISKYSLRAFWVYWKEYLSRDLLISWIREQLQGASALHGQPKDFTGHHGTIEQIIGGVPAAGQIVISLFLKGLFLKADNHFKTGFTD